MVKENYMSTFLHKLCVLSLGGLFCVALNAAEYPAEIQGKWGTSPEYCPGLEIDKKFAVMGTEQTCEAVSVKASGDKFVIKEKCSGEGGVATENTTYQINADSLTRSYRKFSDKYQRCGAPKQAAAQPVTKDAAAAMTCTLVPGAAGVTTFLDDKLKKSGNAIRDFDGYVFKADKKIKVNKTDVLVGKLIRSDGSVSEPKSYVFAEEWVCK
jgi:hypothetical protein